ncbi:hypothetical protein EYR36_011913 [Pleurotus pulmonarius]|nr:hypothetical protein EYR36_011913 [Pleurotus pulmonarius]
MVLASMMALPELRRLEQDLKHAPQNCLETPEVRGSLAKMIDAALDPTNRSIPVIEGECPQVDFESIWSRALPLVVRGAPGLLYDWSPQSLSSLLGDDSCDIIDCETSRVARTTVDAFFRDLIGDAKSGAPILKLKDYPEDMLFKDKSPMLALDFKSALPVPMYTNEDGSLNLAAMYPLDYKCKPDLGPKIYAAMASKQDDDHHGSTRLHMDMADAVNIMAHGRALWHIFRSDDADTIREVLKQQCDSADPINSHEMYLTPGLLKVLEGKGIQPYIFEQTQGDCVFIPAGCAHQVSNISSCVKIATDFVSPQSLKRCARVATKFRDCETIHECLEFSSLLLYAWMSVTVMDSLLPRPSLNLKRKTPPSDHGDELAQWSTVSPEQLDVANAMGAFSTMAVETQQVGPEKPNCINEAIAADAFGTTGSEPPEVVGRENVDAPNETDSYPFNTTASETAEVVDAEKPDGPNEAIATTDADPFDTTANEIPEMVDPEKTNDPSVTDTDAQQALQMLLQVVSNFNRAPNYNANASDYRPQTSRRSSIYRADPTIMPTANMPDEVLRHIFLWLMTLCAAGSDSGHQPWLVVAQVCYQWRIIALDCGELWSIVDLSWPEAKKATHVKRAGVHGLDLICTRTLHTVTVPQRLYASLDQVEAIQAMFKTPDAVVELRVKLNPRFLTNLKRIELGLKRAPGLLPRGLFVPNTLQLVTNITFTNFVMYESIPSLPKLTVLKLEVVQTAAEVILTSIVKNPQLRACWLTWATSPNFNDDMIAPPDSLFVTQLRLLDINTSCPAIGDILASLDLPGDCYLNLRYSGTPPGSVRSFARNFVADPLRGALIDDVEVVFDPPASTHFKDVGLWGGPLHFQFQINEISDLLSVMSTLPFQRITKLNLLSGDLTGSSAWIEFLYSFDSVTQLRLNYPSHLLAELLIFEGRQILFPSLTTLALEVTASITDTTLKAVLDCRRHAGVPVLDFCLADTGGRVDMVEDPLGYERTWGKCDFVAFTYQL